MNNFSHTPVLLTETIDALQVRTGGKIVDATLGGGGHTKLIIQNGGIVLGIDQDQDALDYVGESQKAAIKEKKLTLVKGNFRNIKALVEDNSFAPVDGILFDLGVSSYQLDAAVRGFSIKKDEKLDMRMDRENPLSAYEVVNKYSPDELTDIFVRYGEEHNAKKIAQEIAFHRKKKEIETTKELASIIERVGHKSEAIHPATRVFQAIRIEVNGELEATKKGIEDSVTLLKPGGRIAVISFHSLEDRITKQVFERFRRLNLGVAITKKPLTAGYQESIKNRRSRSAKLRVFEKYA